MIIQNCDCKNAVNKILIEPVFAGDFSRKLGDILPRRPCGVLDKCNDNLISLYTHHAMCNKLLSKLLSRACQKKIKYVMQKNVPQREYFCTTGLHKLFHLTNSVSLIKNERSFYWTRFLDVDSNVC